ncbi:MAG: cell division protein ZapA [Endomicrobiia bacterium]
MKDTISVQILGRIYEIKSDLDPLEVEAIAKYVEEKLRVASSYTGIQETSRIAVLAALNIADELFRLKTEHNNFVSMTEGKTEELINIIDSILK